MKIVLASFAYGLVALGQSANFDELASCFTSILSSRKTATCQQLGAARACGFSTFRLQARCRAGLPECWLYPIALAGFPSSCLGTG